MKLHFAPQHCYLLCVLPDLGLPGSIPPLNTKDLLALVTDNAGPANVVRTLLLSDDLLLREAVMAGEIDWDAARPAVLSRPQTHGEQSLPRFLAPARETNTDDPETEIAADRIWRRYFHHAATMAQITHSTFLKAWVGFEVGLRNTIVNPRAAALSRDPQPFMVMPALADPGISFDDIVDQWRTAPNPLRGHEVLERVRWDWLCKHEHWYQFSDDEVAAYTAKLMLLIRWHRSATKEAS